MNNSARTAVFLFTSLIILSSQISPSFAPNSSANNITSSGTIIYPQTRIKFIVDYQSINDTTAEFIASHFDMLAFDFGAAGFEKVKALNPKITIIGYRDIMAMHTWYQDWSEVNSHEDWFLHDVEGKRVMTKGSDGWYVMDVGNSGWRSHYADFVNAKLAAYPMVDGIFADDVWEAQALTWGMFTVPDDNIPSAIKTNWNSNMAGMIQYVKKALGSKLLIINSFELTGVWINLCDGEMIEHFIHPSSAGLYDHSQDRIFNIDNLETLGATGKIVIALSGTTIPKNPSTSDIGQLHNIMLYCLSGFLLGYSGNAGFGFEYLGLNSYWEEMNAPIGVPAGARYNVQGDLWARDFTNGKVFLNAGDFKTYTINVAGTNYNVVPRSGLIARLT